MTSGETNTKNSTEMKKERLFFIIALAAALALSGVLYSCDGKPAEEPAIEEPEPKPEPSPEEPEPEVPELPTPSEPTIPEDLMGTYWKLAGLVDVETGILNELEPKDCEYCYTLEFNMHSSIFFYSTSDRGGITVYDDNVPIALAYPALVERGDGNLFVEALHFITSYVREGNELKFFYQTDGKESYMLYKLLVPPEDMKGTKWKLAGVVDVGTGGLRELEPKACAECFTLTFYSAHEALGRSVLAGTAIDLLNLRKYIVEYISEASWAGDPSLRIDGDLFRNIMVSIESFAVTSEELKLFYKNKTEYLLFKRIQP
jgi:hypothetical protein